MEKKVKKIEPMLTDEGEEIIILSRKYHNELIVLPNRCVGINHCCCCCRYKTIQCNSVCLFTNIEIIIRFGPINSRRKPANPTGFLKTAEGAAATCRYTPFSGRFPGWFYGEPHTAVQTALKGMMGSLNVADIARHAFRLRRTTLYNTQTVAAPGTGRRGKWLVPVAQWGRSTPVPRYSKGRLT